MVQIIKSSISIDNNYLIKKTKMNIQKMLFFALLLSFTACSAQRNKGKTMDFIEIVKAQKGNTGFRGRVPKEDMNKPNQGKDFYILEIKAMKDCAFDVVDLCVSKNEKEAMMLKIVGDEQATKFNLKKGESVFLRAECDDTIKIITQQISTPGELSLMINKKKTVLKIRKIEEILPN
jgi:hypothetical protein